MEVSYLMLSSQQRVLEGWLLYVSGSQLPTTNSSLSASQLSEVEDGIANLKKWFPNENDELVLARCSQLNLQARTLGSFTYIVTADGTVELRPLTNVWLEPIWHRGMIKNSTGLPRNSQSWVINMLAQWHQYGLEMLLPQFLVISDLWATWQIVLKETNKQKTSGKTHSSSQHSYVNGLLFYHHGSEKQCWQMASHTFKYYTCC